MRLNAWYWSCYSHPREKDWLVASADLRKGKEKASGSSTSISLLESSPVSVVSISVFGLFIDRLALLRVTQVRLRFLLHLFRRKRVLFRLAIVLSGFFSVGLGELGNPVYSKTLSTKRLNQLRNFLRFFLSFSAYFLSMDWFSIKPVSSMSVAMLGTDRIRIPSECHSEVFPRPPIDKTTNNVENLLLPLTL